MKFIAKGDLLTKTLRRCQLGGGSHVNPVHQLVKLDATRGPKGDQKGKLTLTSTVGLLQIETVIAALVEEPGVIAANCKDLGNASGAMPTGDIKVVDTGTRVSLVGSSGRRWSGGLGDPESMIKTPTPNGLPWVGMPVAAIRAALERIGHTTADVRDNERSVDGLLVKAQPGAVTVVGTSGRMCCVLEQKADVRLKAPQKSWVYLIPSLAMGPLREILDEATELEEAGINLYSDGSFMYVEGPSTVVVASMPAGEYLPWELMMSEFPKEPLCVLPRLSLIESIKACQATSSKLDPGGIFMLEGGNVSLHGTADNDYEDTMPCPDMRPNTKLKFKSVLNYMSLCLKNADEDPTLVIGEDGRMILMQTPNGYRASIALMDIQS